MINIVTLTGRVGQDPEPRFFESGNQLVNFTLAVDEFIGSDKPKKTHWFSCKLWGKRGDAFVSLVKKGSKIAVTGRLSTESWDSNGQTHTKVVVVVDDFDLMSTKKD